MSIKSAFCIILIFILLLSVFSLSALAATPDPPELPVWQSGVQYGTYGLYLGTRSSGNPPSTDGSYYATVHDDVEAYVFRVTGSYIYAVSSSPTSVWVGLSNSSSIQFSWSVQSSDQNYPGYYYGYGSNTSSSYLSSFNEDIPVYSTLQEGLSSVISFIESGGEEASTSSFQYSLPPGNVAYIEMGSSSAIKLSMDFPELSNSFGTPFSKANSAYRLVDSLPSVGSAVSSGTIIPWAKSGRLNLIGQTSEASFGPIGPIATRYVAVINPSYYDHVLVTGTYRQNPPIQIDALNVLSIQVYPLQSDFTFNNDTGEVTTTIAGDAYTGDVDSETGEIYWTDPSGGTTAPPLGGNNLPEAGNSIFDTLRNIASDFSEFLKGPVSAIRVVVQSIRDFMGSFTQLYTWLPSPVYNLITSALMIALTIGVIKIFV